ncbi:MAG: tetratricopeptide repeat protein [Flavobacteriales bacterium]
MKNYFFVVAMMLFATLTFAQKKEIKKAQKAIQNENFTEAITFLKQAETLIANADKKTKLAYYVAVGQANTFQAGDDFNMMKTAAEALLKAQELDSENKDVMDGMQNLRATLVNSAIKNQDGKDYLGASKKLYYSYSISKKDTVDLYYAAANAINGKDYDTALNYSQQLVDLGYTGIKKEYYATNKETGEEKSFSDKEKRDSALLTGNFTLPTERNSSSKMGNILRNMTLIFIERGETDKASELMKKAREANPNDKGLIQAEAELAYKSGDMESYNQLMQKVIESDPNNPENYFNIGVVNNKLGNKEKAIENYNKAIELDKNYAPAYINMSSIILDQQVPIVEEMNGLGTSRADYDRYDVLAAKLTQLQKEAIPYLEKTIELRPNDIDFKRTLMNLYSQTGDDAKYKALKSKIQSLEGGQ